VAAVIRQVEDVVGVDVQAVRARILASPRSAGTCRRGRTPSSVLAAVENIDIILAVAGDRGRILELPPVGSFAQFSTRVAVFAAPSTTVIGFLSCLATILTVNTPRSM